MLWDITFLEQNMTSRILNSFRWQQNPLEMRYLHVVEEPDRVQKVNLILEFIILEMSWESMIEMFEIKLQKISFQWHTSTTFYNFSINLCILSKIFPRIHFLSQFNFFNFLILPTSKDHNSPMKYMIKCPINIILIDDLSKPKFLKINILDYDIEIICTFFLIDQRE